MKILLVYAAADWSTVDQSAGYESAFRALGHDVKVFRLSRRIEFWGESLNHWAHINALEEPSVERILREASDWILIEAARYQPDLVLVSSAMGFHPDALQMLRNHAYTTALALSECPYNDVEHAHLAPVVDYVFVNDRDSLDVLLPFNPHTFYVPTAYSEAVHRPNLPMPGNAAETPADVDVLFVGTGFGERQSFLEKAVLDDAWPKDATLQLHGFFGWAGSDADPEKAKSVEAGTLAWEDSPLRPITYPPVTNDETAARYCRAKIVLNFYRNGSGYSLNPRAYEIAACGAFQLAQDSVVEAHEVFGESIAYFSTPHDLAEKVAYWLSPTQDEARYEMSNTAWTRVAGHSYTDRACTIIDSIRSIEPDFGLPLDESETSNVVSIMDGQPFSPLAGSPA